MQPAEALASAERARSRLLLDELAVQPLSISKQEYAALFERESELLIEFEKLQSQTVANKITLEVQQRLSELTSALNATWEEMKSWAPEYVSLRQADIVSYRELREVLVI
jgi:hypothetical protein